MKLDRCTLGAGVDIPFPAAQVTIHAPTIKEIALIGESNFHIGLELLNCQANNVISDMDKTVQKDITNFDILMSMMVHREQPTVAENAHKVELVLSLLFPNYQLTFYPNGIVFKKDDEEAFLKKEDYNDFQSIITQLFKLDAFREDSAEFNPNDNMAAAIAEKLKQGREKVAAQKNNSNIEIIVFEHYISILAVGQNRDKNSFYLYTPWQLYDEFERYIKKYNWDITITAKMNGAKDIKEADNWME
jgi:hypothetical protein